VLAGLAVAHRAFGLESPITPASTFLQNAFCFVLATVSLLFWWAFSTSPLKRRAAQLCGLFVALIGLLTISQYLIGLNFSLAGSGKLFLPGQLRPESASQLGQMPFNTALCYMLSGFALLRLRTRTGRRNRIADWFTLLSGFVALTTIVGFLYGAP